jgi:streptogramin lyase
MRDNKLTLDQSTVALHSRRSFIEIGLGIASFIGLSSCGSGSESAGSKILKGTAKVDTYWAAPPTFTMDVCVYLDGTDTLCYVSGLFSNTIMSSTGWRAGSVVGYVNGPSTTAKVGQPSFIDIDSSKSNLFFSDYGYHTIRKIALTESGTPVSTYAGTPGSAGFINGPSSTAKFRNPLGIAVGLDGTVYVADYGNHAIRAISISGVVSTLAGSGAAGYADGVGTSAQFRSPYSVAVDSANNIYVAESGNHRIRKISPSGAVSTIAGTGVAGNADGDALSATFNAPRGVAVDLSGYLYISDSGNNLIRVLTPAGKVITIAGNNTAGSTDGDALSSSFNRPTGIAVNDNGDIYIADYNNNKVRRISFVSSN